MNGHSDTPSGFFERGIAGLRGRFATRGFTYLPGTHGISSGGRFTNATFRRAVLEIGLVARDGNQLGCPNYSVGNGYAGHTAVIWALGGAGTEELIAGPGLTFVARNGVDPFAAFVADLDTLILPAFDRSEQAFHGIVAAAVQHVRDERGW
jgi:hypothetical protein